MSEPYRYSAGWREILVEDRSDGGAFAKITDQRGGGYEGITLPADERQAAAEALAGDDYRVVPTDRGHATFRVDARCPMCADAAQPDRPEPDRPEPVAPSSLKVGDVVEIEADDGSWMVRGRVNTTAGSDRQKPISIGVPFNFGALWPNVSDATVRILHRPEPEPDEAAVEALAQMLREANGTEQAKAEWDFSPQLVPVAAYAKYLIQRGVTVPEVPDA